MNKPDTKYPGVSFYKQTNRWRAYTRLPNGRRVHLGFFLKEEEAIRTLIFFRNSQNLSLFPMRGDGAITCSKEIIGSIKMWEKYVETTPASTYNQDS